jgi:hypothetical protein
MESLPHLISLGVKSAHGAISLETDGHYRSLGDFGYGSLCNQRVDSANAIGNPEFLEGHSCKFVFSI